MRLGMALCVLLSLIYSPGPVAGQSKPASPQAAPGVPLEAGLAAKLSERPRGAESGGDEFRFYLKNDPTNRLQIYKFFNDPQGGPSAMGIQSPLGTGRCAHIVIIPGPDYGFRDD